MMSNRPWSWFPVCKWHGRSYTQRRTQIIFLGWYLVWSFERLEGVFENFAGWYVKYTWLCFFLRKEKKKKEWRPCGLGRRTTQHLGPRMHIPIYFFYFENGSCFGIAVKYACLVKVARSLHAVDWPELQIIWENVLIVHISSNYTDYL